MITAERNKRLWIRCGFKPSPYYHSLPWLNPSGMQAQLPDYHDMSALFRYAVPRIQRLDTIIFALLLNGKTVVEITFDDINTEVARARDTIPGKALFLACEKALGLEEE